MAEAAEQLVIATGWLPVLMRTPRTAQECTEQPQADVVTETSPDMYSVAAENRHGRDRHAVPASHRKDVESFWPRA